MAKFPNRINQITLNIHMASLIRCLTLLILAISASATRYNLPVVQPPAGEIEMAATHEKWMAQHGRQYKDAAEKELRFKIFKQNSEYIDSVNSDPNGKYKLAPNRFADLTNEEFKATYTRLQQEPVQAATGSSTSTSFRYENVSDADPSVDWRSQGAVTPVKNQGSCGNY